MSNAVACTYCNTLYFTDSVEPVYCTHTLNSVHKLNMQNVTECTKLFKLPVYKVTFECVSLTSGQKQLLSYKKYKNQKRKNKQKTVKNAQKFKNGVYFKNGLM